ncbi:MAG TPA: hypothetical protein GX514_06935 [Thermoanaerobacterales bacterium]|nr:hypothetical protein [Thermoanaerobacterales bacterium]
MRVKVVRNFRDKYTKKLYKVGEELEVTKERYEEINSTAHGILVKEMPEKKRKAKSTRK